ncbi:MAG: tyrosine-type recombinase/integrase [Candidatus Binatia bacterium]
MIQSRIIVGSRNFAACGPAVRWGSDNPVTDCKVRCFFARTHERPMSENAVLAALRRMGYTKDEMTGHGFRSMASTLLHEQGSNHQAIERQLAHAERNAVSAAYNFAEHLPERRKMMQAWADYLDGRKAGAEVIPLFKQT